MQVLSYAVNSSFPTPYFHNVPQALVFVNQFLREANYSKRLARPQGGARRKGDLFFRLRSGDEVPAFSSGIVGVGMHTGNGGTRIQAGQRRTSDRCNDWRQQRLR